MIVNRENTGRRAKESINRKSEIDDVLEVEIEIDASGGLDSPPISSMGFPLNMPVIEGTSEMNITHGAIASRAYQMWQEREEPQHGDEFLTWLQAEASLLHEQRR